MKPNNTWIVVFLISVMALLSGCNATEELKEDKLPNVDSAADSSAADSSAETTATIPSADGTPIFYGTRGEGEITLVFVHCWSCNSEFWQDQIEYFAKDYKVVWLDLAGHGKSGSQRQEYTMPAFGNDIAAVVNEVGTDKVVLVGHSMGGFTVMEAAKLLGDRVIGIVGVDIFYTSPDESMSDEQIEALIQPFKDDFKSQSEQMVRSMFTPSADPELVNSIVEQMGSANPEMAISAFYEIFKWKQQQESSSLAEYSDKLRNINGAPKGSETALDESVTLIPEVGHFVAQVKPDEFNQTLEQILAEY